VVADIADATGRPRAGRVGAPAGLFLAGGFEPRGQPALRIFDHDLAQRAEPAFAH
jgi:hypothetical protein